MRSITLIVAALALLGATGCPEKNKGIETAQDPATSDSSMVDSGAYSTDAGATDPYGTQGADKYNYSDTNAPLDTSNTKPLPPDQGNYAGGGKTHVVQKGDTLYKIARDHYGDQSKWRSIFEANRDQLSDPHRLKVGQTLTLP